MGNKDSKEIRNKDNSLLSFEENSIDYEGIKTSEEKLEENKEYINENSGENNNSIIEKDILDKNSNSKINKVPVTFEWESGGNSVYLTGNFCNWNQFFLMKKNPNGKHTLTLNLKKGFIQYKFKIENEWKYNEKCPTIIDNGNKNNFIDTTNWEISAETSVDTTNTNTESSFKQNENNKSLNASIEFKNSQNNYCNYFPKKNEMNDLTIKIPEQYKNKINLDKKIGNKIGNKNFFSHEEKNIFGDNYSYKSIMSVMPVQINHINFKEKNIKNNSKEPIVYSIVSRHRLKFTTFVYYKNK